MTMMMTFPNMKFINNLAESKRISLNEKKNIVKISTRFKAGEAAMQLPPAAPPRKVNPAAPF